MCPLNVYLQQFSADIAEKASNVCLAHLFTYQDFDEGTLGLAYVAPSKPDIAGGLCSKGTDLQVVTDLPTCLKPADSSQARRLVSDLLSE